MRTLITSGRGGVYFSCGWSIFRAIQVRENLIGQMGETILADMGKDDPGQQAEFNQSSSSQTIELPGNRDSIL
jgi:hypothetical protein